MNVSYVKIFNQVVDDFYNELIEIFPEEVKIKVQYTLFQTIIMCPLTVIDLIMFSKCN